MYADGGILLCDARLLREVVELTVVQIDHLQRLSIFRLESREKRGNTLADFLPQHGIGLLNVRVFPAPCLHGPCSCGAVTVMIDHGIAQGAIEPGDNVLVLHPSPSLQSAHKRLLQDVFGYGSGLDAPFQEGQKFAVSFNELRYGFGR